MIPLMRHGIAACSAINGAFVKWPPPSLPRNYRGRGKSITADCDMDPNPASGTMNSIPDGDSDVIVRRLAVARSPVLRQ